MKKSLALTLILAFVLNLAACGTILYPERRGQTGGQLDPAVVIMDGVGLFFFLVPGIVAFVVDLSNGTIYLPGTQQASLNGENTDHTVVRVGNKVDARYLETLIADRYGVDIDIDSADVRAIDSLDAARMSAPAENG
jgi:hypothetical protein